MNIYCRLRRMRWQDGFSELSGRIFEFSPITGSDIRSRRPGIIETVVALSGDFSAAPRIGKAGKRNSEKFGAHRARPIPMPYPKRQIIPTCAKLNSR